MCARIPSRLAWVRFIVIGSACLVAASTALAAGVGTQVQELFDTAWKPSSESFAAAHPLYDQAKAAAPTDVRVPLAMTLLSVKNYKNDEAAKYIDLAIPVGSTAKVDPLGLSARRLKVWLQVLRKDHTGAQATMHELASILGTEDPIAPSEEAKKTAEWMGGVLAYYAGPAATQTASTVNVETLQNELAGSMKSALGNILADGKAAGLRTFADLQSQQSKARDEIRAKLAAKRADDLKKNSAAQSALSEKINKLDSDKSDTKAAKPDAQAERNTQRIEQEGNKLEQQLANEMRKPKRNEQAIRRLENEIGMLKQQLAQANGNDNNAQKDAAKKQAAEAEKKRLQGLQGSLTAQGKQLSSASEGGDVATPIDAKLASLSSYAPIDFEKEKQRILDSYAAK